MGILSASVSEKDHYNVVIFAIVLNNLLFLTIGVFGNHINRRLIITLGCQLNSRSYLLGGGGISNSPKCQNFFMNALFLTLDL